MVYRKSNFRKKTFKKKSTKTSRARVPAATKKYVRKMMPKTEMKESWIHTNEVALNTLAQGHLIPFPVIGQAITADGRVGNHVNARSLHFKGSLYNNSGAETYVRQLVVGYAPTVDIATNLFRLAATNTSAAISSINGMDAMYYPINKTDFHVYHDRTYKLAGSVSGVNGSNTRMFSRFIKLGGKKITWKGADANPDNYTYSIVHIASDANDDTTTGTTVEMSSLTRFYYTDG